MEKKVIYLDYNASTPIDPRVAEAMKPFLDKHFGNPSSSHAYGSTSRMAVEEAREHLARLIHCEPWEIIFTSGGTESNNMAIKGAAFANQHKGKHIITSQVEHPAVTEVCSYLEKQSFSVSYLPVDEYGMVNPDDVEKALRPDTILISIMHANNEVGSIQPIEKIGLIAKRNGILFHSDAAQSTGKIPVDVQKMQVDLLSIAGHKLYAPKGVGALYIRTGVQLEKFMHGADHERNLRAGTENILEIVGLGEAAQLAMESIQTEMPRQQSIRDYLYQELLERHPEMKLNGHPEIRLPNTLNVSFPGVEANTLLAELQGVAASAGAACHSEQVDVSPVIEAMKIPTEYAMGTVRFSVGKYSSFQEIDEAVSQISESLSKLKTGNDPGLINLDWKEIKLTHFTHGLGCACKLRPQVLEEVLQNLPPLADTSILVGTESSDDAAVVAISEDMALVQTLDFFTPIADDPYLFGAIAAANALSDIYAMGAKPMFALNIVGFPSNRLPIEVLKQILTGAQDKAAEAGIPILGGHTVDDTEPKYGMVVNGRVHPDKILRNNTAKPNDVILLTKPIGTGILATALKRGLLQEVDAVEFQQSMARLNKLPAEIMESFPVSACTDVTGFGLLGHLKEMSGGSGVDVELWSDKVPVFPKVKQFIAANVIPGGTKDNLAFVQDWIQPSPQIDELSLTLLADAQTSGGLLIAIKEDEADRLLQKLLEAGIESTAIIGKFRSKGKGIIHIL